LGAKSKAALANVVTLAVIALLIALFFFFRMPDNSVINISVDALNLQENVYSYYLPDGTWRDDLLPSGVVGREFRGVPFPTDCFLVIKNTVVTNRLSFNYGVAFFSVNSESVNRAFIVNFVERSDGHYVQIFGWNDSLETKYEDTSYIHYANGQIEFHTDLETENQAIIGETGEPLNRVVVAGAGGVTPLAFTSGNIEIDYSGPSFLDQFLKLIGVK
jgi:hypothetical protein